MFIPVISWWILPIILLGWAMNSMWKNATKTTLPEIKYDDLSEKRKQKARDRADNRGFIYLGSVKRHLDADLSWYMTSEENVVCRFDGEEIGFYTIKSRENFFKGMDSPEPMSYGIPISQIERVQAWGQPGGASGVLKISLRPLLGATSDFVEARCSSQTRESTTDALILIRERCETYMESQR